MINAAALLAPRLVVMKSMLATVDPCIAMKIARAIIKNIPLALPVRQDAT
jgi:hypothetical protein